MSGLTVERLAELRRIAEAATPGPWRIPGANVFRVVAPKAGHHNPPSGKAPPYPWAIIADADTEGTSGEQAASNMQYIATFDPPTVLALLDEIERLMERQRKVRHALRAAVNHIGEPQHPYERAGISHLQLALQVLDGRYDREEGHGQVQGGAGDE